MLIKGQSAAARRSFVQLPVPQQGEGPGGGGRQGQRGKTQTSLCHPGLQSQCQHRAYGGETHTHTNKRTVTEDCDLLSRNLIWSQNFHTVSYFMLNEKFRQEHAKGFYTHNHCKIFNYTALPQSELKMQAERSRFRLRHKNLPGPINKLINKVTH